MTEQEYQENKERIDEYSKLKSEIERLKDDRRKISDGLLFIQCESRNYYIDCTDRYDGFRDKLNKHIICFLDAEIERLEGKLSDI